VALFAILFISVSCEKEKVEEEVINKNVLIIYDDSTTNVNTQLLKTAMVAAGFEVSFSDVSETDWNNTNPTLDNFFAVLHFSRHSFGYLPSFNYS
jgi:hypothetical protein